MAVLGGAAIADVLEPYAAGLRVGSAAVLLAIAVLTVGHALTRGARPTEAGARSLRPWHAFTAFLAITAVNPTTVVYFVAVVIGNPHLASGWAQGIAFVMAACAASASWQLTLAFLGSALGRKVTSDRGRLVTGLVSGLVIAALAGYTLLAS